MTKKPAEPRIWVLKVTVFQKDGNYVQEWEFKERPRLVHATATKLTLVEGVTPEGEPLEVALPAGGALFEIERMKRMKASVHTPPLLQASGSPPWHPLPSSPAPKESVDNVSTK